MENRFYQNNPEYKPVEMSKKRMIEHLTKIQDECFDEELAKKCYKIPGILKKDFAYHFNVRYNRPLKKEVIVFSKGGSDICGSFCMTEPMGMEIREPVKVAVVIKSAPNTYQVWSFDWDDKFFDNWF